jgi:hypothetical protein
LVFCGSAAYRGTPFRKGGGGEKEEEEEEEEKENGSFFNE